MKRVKKLVVSLIIATALLLVTSGIVFAADAGITPNKTSLNSASQLSTSAITTFKVKPNNGIKNGKVRVIYGTISELLSAGQTKTYQIQYDSNGNMIDEVAFEGAGNDGYAFYSWTYTPNHVYNDNPNGHRIRTITTNDQTFTPNPKFKKVYTLDVNIDPVDGGIVTQAPNSSYYFEGDTVTLTAVPTNANGDRYIFTGWSGDASGTSATTTITMDSNKSVNASFRPKVSPILEYTIDNGNGTYTAHFGYLVRGSTNVSFSVGSSNKFNYQGNGGLDLGQPITFEAGRHYDVFSINFDGSNLVWSLDGSTATASSGNVKYLLNVSTNPSGGGVVNISPDKSYYSPGETVTLTAVPTDNDNDIYLFNGWTGDASGHSLTTTVTMDGNKTVTASFRVKEFGVTFCNEDGSPINSQSVPFGTPAVRPENPQKEGYTFAGWSLSGDNNSYTDSLDTVKENLVATATFDINQYTVTFVDHDGTELGNDTVNWNTPATAPANPSREGHTFAGWDSDFSAVKNTMTVTATYTINTYTVTFVDYDGTVLGTDTVNWNTGATAPANPSREGHTFAGWDSDFSAVKNTVTVTATYTINTYTVTFVDYDGTVLGTDVVNWNTGATAPADPSREGHTFAGWDSDFSAVKNTVTVTATYTINTFTVTFVDHDGTVLDTDTVNWNTGATAPVNPSREGHTFAGWDSNFSAVENDMTVTATYTINTYTVSFVDYDGTVLGTDTVNWNTGAAAPADPSREGYTFAGWGSDFSAVQNNMTIAATYTINTFIVTFVDYDGTVLSSDIVDWNTAAAAPADPTRTGYTFTGWDADFTTVTADITTTAMYAINTYTVTFVDYDGTVLGTDRARWNTGATAPEEPQRVGFAFVGWDTDFERVRGNLTVTATYEPIMLNVQTSIIGNGEINDNLAGAYAYGTEIDLDSIAVTPADGYEFAGWQDQNGNIVTTITLTADTQLTAVFTAITVTIADEDVPNAGSDNEEDVEAIASEDVPLAKPQAASALWWLLMILPVGLLLWFLLAWKNGITPIAESVSDNGDGTFTVIWGYENKKHRKISVDRSKSKISALSGKIVGGKGSAPNEFEKGEAHSVFTTVAEKGSKLQWQIRSKKTTVSDE